MHATPALRGLTNLDLPTPNSLGFNPPMAVDQNSNPADLRPLNLNNRAPLPISADPNSPRSSRPLFYPDPSHPSLSFHTPPPTWAPPSILPAAAIRVDQGVTASAADEAGPGEESVGSSPRKVKFLCSFGGRILPRPSDGTLRYVGGNTRIISLRKDSSFSDLMAKMADAFGGPVVLKYQLPDEDLDALVSVSCAEDLENMMEEYDKLAEAAPDGSAKLRAFLFPVSELGLDSSGSADLLEDAHDDTGQRYVDAVNGLAPEQPLLRRKDSAASATSAASSTQNSDCPTLGDATDATTAEGTSSALQSPKIETTAAHDASRLGYLGGATTATVAPGVLLDPPSGGLGVPAPAFNPAQAAPYVPPPSYIDPSQVHYMNPQHLGVVGGPLPVTLPINTQAFVPVHPFMPPVHVTTAPQSSQVSNSVKPIQTSYLEENPYGARAAHLPSDHNYKAHQPLSQFPPLPPTYLQPQNVERYELWQVPQPPQEQQQGKTLRLEDCYMCQKALPHVHSDSLIQENGSGSASSVPEVNPVFYSQHSEDAVRQRGQHRVLTGAMANNVMEPKVESMIPVSQLGSYGLTQVPEVQYGGERQPIRKPENFDHSRVLLPPGSTGFPADILSSNLPQSPQEDSLQQQQQQQIRQNLVPPHYPVKPDMIAKPISTDVSSVRITNLQAAEPLLGYSHDYVRPIDAMMESLRIIPPEASRLDEQGEPVVRTNVGTPKDLKPDISPLVVEDGYIARPQVGGNAGYAGNSFLNPGMISEGKYVNPIEQLLPASLEAPHLHNLQSVDTSQILTMAGNPGPYPHTLDSGLEPPVPNERLLGMPTFSRNFDLSYNHDGANMIPIDHQKDESSQFPSKNVPNPIAPPLTSNFSTLSLNTNSPTEHTQYVQEPFQSDSLFSNQDPWKIVGSTNLLPPKPNKVASKEPAISKDLGIENHLERSNGSNLVAILEEGGLHQPLNSLNKYFLEPVRSAKGSPEEKVKQDLQAVAEGVAASVLQSSTPPVPVFYAHERKEPSPESNKERNIIEENANSHGAAAIVDGKFEDIKSKQLEKVNLGLPSADDIGRLQIIKNSDLEELRELGSGTFGTVYHGKWRGTDVAIKRINDRCFAGKPSEQERMRADFWNEACKLADLHHPNVVAFYGVVLDGPGGSVATVTEFMVNGSLRHALQRNDKTLDRRKRVLIARDVAFGMEYLHGKNIVHFDLKSDNLLVNLRDPQRPICKVGDLGLSKVKCQTLISGGVRGTLPWMAPELLNGSSSLVSEKVDVFSFGIVMWELLTGEEPYADLHYGAIIGGIVSNTLRPPVPDSCDPEWRLLMEQCWFAEPSERPSFTEIASRLRSMAASLTQKGSGPAHPGGQPHTHK